MKVKRIYFFILLTALLLDFTLKNVSAGQLSTLNSADIVVSGKILNDSTGKGVPNHGVNVSVPYISYQSTVYTDTSGNYADTVRNLPGLGDTLTVRTYDCHNIVHSQSQPIQSYSLIINFTICVTYSPHCHADFTAEFDSASIVPEKYQFYDLSTGNPDHWLWDFGDGTSSADRNPVHVYSKSGNYKVCLSIARDSQGSPCSDSVCSVIIAPKYYSIGGHVFAGTHPVNNPLNTGDTAIAYLYRFIHNRILPFDTLSFTYLGYFSFPQLLPGEYLVKAVLTSGSGNARAYAPAYYTGQLYWQQAAVLGISDSSIFNFDIHLVHVNDSLKGIGTISGKAEKASQASEIFNISRSEVMLLDSARNLLTYTLCDTLGNFAFHELPFGNYLLFVESTGKFSRFTPVSIDAVHPVIDTLTLGIYDHNILGIPDATGGNEIIAGAPFPNPASSRISIPVNVLQKISLKATLASLQSNPLIETGSEFGPGKYLITFDLEVLPAGMYILSLSTSDGYHVLIRKIIKY